MYYDTDRVKIDSGFGAVGVEQAPAGERPRERQAGVSTAGCKCRASDGTQRGGSDDGCGISCQLRPRLVGGPGGDVVDDPRSGGVREPAARRGPDAAPL